MNVMTSFYSFRYVILSNKLRRNFISSIILSKNRISSHVININSSSKFVNFQKFLEKKPYCNINLEKATPLGIENLLAFIKQIQISEIPHS